MIRSRTQQVVDHMTFCGDEIAGLYEDDLAEYYAVPVIIVRRALRLLEQQVRGGGSPVGAPAEIRARKGRREG
jgi:hypothetical protein